MGFATRHEIALFQMTSDLSTLHVVFGFLCNCILFNNALGRIENLLWSPIQLGSVVNS